ncbi:hypothetical protein VTI74DRAFT_6880 [Chaetomium olivicolor]
MAGAGVGAGPGDHYHLAYDCVNNPPPPWKPVAAITADPAQVSPPEVSYHAQPARASVSTTQTRMPQRMGTISSGGKFTVSPASSIHEDDEGDAWRYGEGIAGGEPSPSPPQGYRHTTPGQTQGERNPGTQGQASLWQTRPREDEIPYLPPQHWRGSRDLQELVDARARELESGKRPVRTSSGPGPVSTSATLSAPAPVRTTGTDVTWLTLGSWQTAQQGVTPSQQNTSRAQNGARSGPGPFMHYEDLDYFGPVSEHEPKDESQVDEGVPRADTFPATLEGMNRPQARRSWDRQRKRRRKKNENGNGGRRRGGGSNGIGGEKGGCRAVWHYCKHWLPEILCCLFSIVCLAVIVAVLKTYEGRGLTDWPLTVSLNTLVAFLTAICQVALSVPLTEGFSQLKWNSFARGEKPLADFQTFEDAKRGPVGSTVFLCKRKGRALGMIAATALITGFLLSPLTQGAITHPTRSFEAGSGTATVARSESYSHPTPYERLDAREKQAIQSGIHHPVDSEIPPLQPLCSSGDCQWRNFSSLAICAALADVSNRLTVSNQTRPRNFGISLGVANDEPARAAALPNGVFLVGSTSTCNLNISWPHTQARTTSGAGDNGADGEESFLPAQTSLAFAGQDGRVLSAIANFFLVYTNQTGELAPDAQRGVFHATEVLLHFCVNTYQVSTSGGVSTSKVVHSSTLVAQDEASNTLVDARSPASRRVVLRSSSGGGVYSVKRDDVKLLNNYLLDGFSGVYSDRYGKAIGGETATSEALGTAMFRAATDSEEMRTAVRNWTTNVATSMTNTQVDFFALPSSSRTPFVCLPPRGPAAHPAALFFPRIVGCTYTAEQLCRQRAFIDLLNSVRDRILTANPVTGYAP